MKTSILTLAALLTSGARAAFDGDNVNPNDVTVDCGNLRSSPVELTSELTLHAVIDPIQNRLIAELVLQGIDAWIGMGFTNNNAAQMLGSEAAIGLPEDNDVSKYNLNAKELPGVVRMPAERQTLIDTFILQTGDSQTVMRFTKILEEPGEHAIAENELTTFLFAHGSGNALGLHSVFGSVDLLANQCEVRDLEGVLLNPDEINRANANIETADLNRKLWVAHGVCASVAWAILIPLGIGASIIRKVLEQKLKLPAGAWFQIHRGLNTLAVLLTVAAFALAVKATNESTLDGVDPDHFSRTTHTLTGLIVFILTLMQALNGILRPHLPSTHADKASSTPESSTGEEEQNSTVSDQNQDARAAEEGVEEGQGGEGEDTTKANENSSASTKKKSLLRRGWEIGHRLLGLGLLGFAWWQVQDGLSLFDERFQEDYDLDQVFWIVVSTLVGLILVVALYQRIAL